MGSTGCYLRSVASETGSRATTSCAKGTLPQYDLDFFAAPAGSITKKAERATGSQQIARPRVAERTRNIQCRAERAAGSQQMARPEVAEAPAQADEAATQNGLLAAYDRLARERPLLVNSLTALVGVSLGDIIAQLGSGATLDTFDIARWLRMSSFGLLLGGPACYKFYEWIDATVYPDRR